MNILQLTYDFYSWKEDFDIGNAKCKKKKKKWSVLRGWLSALRFYFTNKFVWLFFFFFFFLFLFQRKSQLVVEPLKVQDPVVQS